MPSNYYPLFAREAWPVFLLLMLLALFAWFFSGEKTFIFSLSILFLAFYLFRDPVREIPSRPLAIVSPVHGVVTLVEETKETPLNERARHVQIVMRLYDIYSLRSPTEGKVTDQWSSPPDENQPRRHLDFCVRTDEGDKVIIAIRPRNIIHHFRVYLQQGERVGQGQRCGYLCFGGVIDVFLPFDSRVLVEAGQFVNAGSDLLAQLIHRGKVSAIENELG